MELLRIALETKALVDENSDSIRLVVSGVLFFTGLAGTVFFSTIIHFANKEGSAGLLLYGAMLASLALNFVACIIFLASVWYLYGAIYASIIAIMFIASFLYMRNRA